MFTKIAVVIFGLFALVGVISVDRLADSHEQFARDYHTQTVQDDSAYTAPWGNVIEYPGDPAVVGR